MNNGTFKSEEASKLIEDLFHEDYRSHFGTNSNLEELRSNHKIRKYLAEYYNCTEEEICTGDYIPKEETTCPYKVILGNAYFSNSYITDLGKLQSIEEDVDFSNSNITGLGNLQSIGGSVNFYGSKVTNLGNLQSIGGNPYFSYSNVTDLGNLQSIGGSVDFGRSKVTNLGNLQSIGGNVGFSNSNITDLGNIEYIGGKIITDETNDYLREEYESKVKGRKI